MSNPHLQKVFVQEDLTLTAHIFPGSSGAPYSRIDIAQRATSPGSFDGANIRALIELLAEANNWIREFNEAALYIVDQ